MIDFSKFKFVVTPCSIRSRVQDARLQCTTQEHSQNKTKSLETEKGKEEEESMHETPNVKNDRHTPYC